MTISERELFGSKLSMQEIQVVRALIRAGPRGVTATEIASEIFGRGLKHPSTEQINQILGRINDKLGRQEIITLPHDKKSLTYPKST